MIFMTIALDCQGILEHCKIFIPLRYLIDMHLSISISLAKILEGNYMDRKELMEMFNKRTRIGALCTANRQGDVNAAVFGSPYMIDENTVVMGIGNNRSFKYLKENPKAVFILMEPGKTPSEWKGARIYLEAIDIETSGGLFDQIKSNIESAAGKAAAKMIKAAIRFRVKEVRPLIDPNP